MKSLQKILALCLISLSVFFFGCEIGLGSAIDVEAPLIKIEYPPEAAVARGTLTVKGTCSDDQQVTTVYVCLVNSKTDERTEKIRASISGNNWSATFDTTQLKDGKYTAQAYSLDNTDKPSLVYSRSLDIDNTAPVFIVSKPLSINVDNQNPSAYGRVLKLAGDIADDHGTVSLKFNYKRVENGSEISDSINVENFKKISSDEPLVIARYYDDADPEKDEQLLANYKAVYGNIAPNGTQNSDKEIFCTIEIEDEAKEYNGNEDESRGNISNRYYVNSTEFNDLLMSEKAYGLTATKLKTILNGNYESYYTDQEKEDILQIINDQNNNLYVESTTILENNGKTSILKLNPDNNPFYLLGGYSADNDKGQNYNKFNVNNSILITIECGSDEVEIDEKTVEVEFTRTNDNKKFVYKYNDLKSLWQKATTSMTAQLLIMGEGYGDDAPKTDGKYFFSSGNSYLVKITGKDKNGVEIKPKEAKFYGFELSSTTTAPKTELSENLQNYRIDELENGIVIKFTLTEDNSHMFTGNYSNGAQNTTIPVNNPDYDRISITNQKILKNGTEVNDISIEKKSLIIKDRSGNDYYTYELELTVGYTDDTVKKCAEGDNKYTYNLEIQIIDTQSNKTTLNPIFYIDCNKPEIGGFADAENTVVNGTFTINGTVKDNLGVKEVTYKINDEDPIKFNDFSNPKSDEIDSTKYPDKSTLTIEVKAIDEVGYKKTKPLTYKIDQSSDAPVIVGSNFDVTISDVSQLEYKTDNDGKTNIFNKTDKLTGYITDDDGDFLSAPTVDFYKTKAPNGTYSDQVESGVSKTTGETGSGKTFNNVVIPSDPGIYYVVIEAKDSKQESTGYNTSTKEFVIAVDNEAPTIKETIRQSDAEFYTNGKVEFLLEFNDDWDTDYIYDNLNDDSCKVEDSNGNTVTITPTWGDVTESSEVVKTKKKVTLDLSDSKYTNQKYKVTFTITDRAGKTATVVRNFQIEIDKPTIEEAKFTPDAKDNNYYYSGSELTVEGKVTDDSSGIAKVEYNISGSNDWQTFSITPEGTNATFKSLISGLTNGKTITIKATDKAGNESETTTLSVKIDTTAPSVSSIKEGTNELTESSTYRFNKGTTKEFTFTVSDDESGIDSVTCSVSDATVTEDENKAGSYTLTIPAGKITSTGSLYVTAKDKVGNEKDYKICNIIYDDVDPEVSLKTVKYYSSDNSLKAGNEVDYNDANGKITIAGTASDSELNTITLQYKTKTATEWSNYGEPVTSNPQSWSFDVDTADETKFTDKSVYLFRICGEDQTGNPGYSSETGNTLYVNQDSDRPIITFTNMYYDKTDEKCYLKKTKELYLNIQDDDGDVQTATANSEPIMAGKYEFTEDGTTTVSFSIKQHATDKEDDGKTFDNPRLIGNDGKEIPLTVDASTSSKYITITVDTTPPEITEVKFASTKEKDATVDSTDYKDKTKDVVFGGEHKYFNVQLKPTDSNGIKEVCIKKGDEVVGDTVTNIAKDATVIIKNIPVDTLASGNHEYKIYVTDKAGMESHQSFSIYVDNTAPTITTNSPDYEELEGIAFTIKGEVDGSDQGSSIKYLVDTKPGNYETDAEDWNNATAFTAGDTVTTWRLYVDGDVNNTGDDTIKQTHTKSHKQLFVDAYNNIVEFNDSNLIVEKGKTDLYVTPEPLYFHFLVADNAGNKGTCTLKLMIDPQGDIPTVKVDSPVVSEYLWYSTSVQEWIKDIQGNSYDETQTVDEKEYKYKGKGTTLSGSITVQGTADPKVGMITGVYMQIDPTYDPTTGFDENIWKGSSADNVRNKILCPNGADNSTSTPDPAEKLPATDYDIREIGTGSGMYGVWVGDSTAWSKTINQNNLFVYSTGSNKIALRFYATNTEGKTTTLNKLNDLILTIDSEAPIIAQYEPFYFYQYKWTATDGSAVYTNKATVTTSDKAYSNPGCSTGETAISVKTDTTITVGGKTYTKDFISKSFDEGNGWITGEWWLRFSVHDEQDIYEIKVGNETVVTKNNGNEDGKYDANGQNSTVEREKSKYKGFIVNYRVGTSLTDDYGKTDYTITATDYKADINDRKTSNRKISVSRDNKAPSVNNDQYFNISDYVVNSNGSYDFGTAAYEDAKESGFRTVLYYFKKTQTNKIYKLSKTGTTKDTSSYSGEKDIYVDNTGIKVTAISGNTVTVESVTNLKTGKMVEFGGSYYLINKVSGTTVELDGKPSANLINDNLYVVLGNVVPDNQITSSGGRYIWNAEINSNTIDDGPIEINYVIFDKAGNMTHGTVDAIVGNNAPRIASVRVWCDKNRNTTQQPNEYQDFFYNEITVNGVTKAGEATSNLLVVGDTTKNNRKVKLAFPTSQSDDEPAPFMTVKDVFKITPEIVGGNGALKYSYVLTTNKNEVIDAAQNGWDPSKIKKINTSFGTSTIDGTDSSNYLSNGQITNSAKFENKIEVTGSDLADIYNDGTGNNGKITYFEFTIWDSTPYLTQFTNSLHAKIQLAIKVLYKDQERPNAKIGKFGYGSNWNNSTDEDGILITEKYKANATDEKATIPYSHVYGLNGESGHVELEDDWIKAVGYDSSKTSGEFDKDAKVSGYITMRGIASDDIYIDQFKVTFPGIATNGVVVAENVNGTMTAKSGYSDITTNGLKYTTISEVYDDDGHHIEWQIDIDTSKVNANKVATDVQFKLEAIPARGNNMTSPETYRMDVVPYIYEVTTTLPDDYKRTALGHYPISKDPTIKCFNYDGAAFTINDDATSDEFVVTKNNIQSLNNLNNPKSGYATPAYNQIESEMYNLLSDDVYFDVWDINSSAAIPHDDSILDAQMKINPSNGLIGFAFCNGKGRFSMPNGTGSSYTSWSRSPDFFQCTGFAYDASGNAFATALGGESNTDYNLSDNFNFFSNLFGCPGTTNYNNSRNSGSALHIGSLYQKGTKTNANGDGIFNKKRYANPSITTSGNYVYLAYYDRINDEIRFHAGELKDDKKSFKDGNTFQNNYSGANLDGETHKYKTTECQIVAGSGSGANGGEYVSIAATSNNKVIMVWYDSSAMDLKYSYKNAATIRTGVNRTDWTDPVSLTPGIKAGEYCQVVVDSDNNVHIACYDIDNSALRYIFIDDYQDPETKISCLVDSYMDVGTFITIDVAKEKVKNVDYQIPHIGYYANSPEKPVYAYIADPATFYKSGATEAEYSGAYNDKYTGTWEISPVPTAQTIYYTEDTPLHMNVGVWKSMEEGKVGFKKSSTKETSSASTGSGNCYGNGTSNAVMGYLIENGSSTKIETAQKRD